MKNVLPTLVCAVACACRAPQATAVDSEPAAAEAPFSEWFAVPDAENERLYPNGEGVHDAPEAGSRREAGPFPHDMEPTGTGRMYLLELYQQAIDDKEALERELAGLTQALDQAYGELESARGEAGSARAALAESETERERLQQENEDLTARLATAQIRRLEAEKMLLEAKIEWAVFLAGEEQELLGEDPPAESEAAARAAQEEAAWQR